MESSNSSRKRRLQEALEYSAVAQKLHHSMHDTEDADASTTFIPYRNIQMHRKEPALQESLELKLRVLEKWELTKRCALERLSQDIEEVLQKESEIEKLETLRTRLDKRRPASILSYSSDYDQPLDMTTPKSCQRRLSQPATATTPTTRRESTKVRRSSDAGAPLQIKVFQEVGDDMVMIGPHGTTMSRNALNSINWSLSGPAITRKVLMEVFDRETLAFHTLTGKPSPAFMDCDKPLKHRLEPGKVADIVHIITENLPMTPKEVRSAITTKCADENKMFRQREKKRLSILGLQKNNNNTSFNNNYNKYSDNTLSDTDNKENSL